MYITTIQKSAISYFFSIRIQILSFLLNKTYFGSDRSGIGLIESLQSARNKRNASSSWTVRKCKCMDGTSSLTLSLDSVVIDTGFNVSDDGVDTSAIID